MENEDEKKINKNSSSETSSCGEQTILTENQDKNVPKINNDEKSILKNVYIALLIIGGVVVVVLQAFVILSLIFCVIEPKLFITGTITPAFIQKLIIFKPRFFILGTNLSIFGTKLLIFIFLLVVQIMLMVLYIRVFNSKEMRKNIVLFGLLGKDLTKENQDFLISILEL